MAIGIFIWMVSIVALPQETTTNVDPGVSIELAEKRKSQILNLTYSLSFSLEEQRPILGGIAIDFDWRADGGDVVIDFSNPRENIKSCTVNYVPVQYRFENGHIVISAKNLKEGRNSVGIEFVAGDLSLNRNSEFIYTLLVPDRASTVFPCFDQPDLKAEFELQLEIPIDWEASANAEIQRDIQVINASPENKKRKRRLITFCATKPISTYLFSFAAGKFQKISRVVEGRTMTMLHRESDSKKVARNVDKIFEIHGLALKWLEEYTGIQYPFAKFDFVLIPSFQYGGMEHVGNIFYNADQLFLESSATIEQKLNRASLIAHETAHMWFGNLVTMKWFNDVWLKEVFANFMAAKIVNPGFPNINHELGFLFKHHPSAYGEDRSLGSHPIQQRLENLKDAGTLYGRIIYQKAPVVMRQLELKVGVAKFQEGIREYLERFSFSNAVWDDLIAILDQKTEEDLETWSDTWIKRSGRPEIESAIVRGEKSRSAINIRQLKSTKSGEFWGQSIKLKVVSDNKVVFEKSLDVDQESLTYSLPLEIENYDFFLANASELGYGHFLLDAKSQAWLLNNINSVEDDMIRGAARIAMYESMLEGCSGRLENPIPPSQYLMTLVEGIGTEKEPLNRQNLLNQLEIVFWKLIDSEARSQVAGKLEDAFWSKLGFAPEVNSTINRRAPENGDSNLGDAQSVYWKSLLTIFMSQRSAERIHSVWEGEVQIKELELSEKDLVNVAMELAIRLPERSDEILKRQTERIKNQDRKRRLEFVKPALSYDVKVRQSFFESLKLKENRRPERWVLEALHFLHHPLRASESQQFIGPSLEMLPEIQETGDIFFPKRWLAETFSGHASPEAASIVIKFLEQRPDFPFRLRNKILQAADLLLRVNGINQARMK